VNPDDIPTEITKLVYTLPFDTSKAYSQDQAADLLAHFWPAIEERIREQVADEIGAAAEKLIGHEEPAMTARCLGLRAAARIARNPN
jgi:hypothetical protein